MINKTTCSRCGARFEVNLLCCQECSSGDRNVAVTDAFNTRDDLRNKRVTPNPKGGKPIEEFTQRTKISGEAKREAIDKITKDRSKGRTVVRHEVWEQDEQGRWFKVHGHYKN